MGLGGYLAARSDIEHYDSERKRERQEVQTLSEVEARETEAIFLAYGITQDECAPVVAALRKRPEAWVDFMMRFELGLVKTEPKRALTSALTIAGAYIAGGFIPLGPYLLIARASTALWWSAMVTIIALMVFGYIKGRFSGTGPMRSAIQTVLIGCLAAAAAFLIARAIS